MECKFARDLLSEYIDDMLDAATKKDLEGHLAACVFCSEELAALKKSAHMLGSLPPVKAPDDFLQQVRERIDRRSEFEKMMGAIFASRKIRLPLEAVGVLVTVVLVVVLYKAIEPELRPYDHKPAINNYDYIREGSYAKKTQEQADLILKKESAPESQGVVGYAEPEASVEVAQSAPARMGLQTILPETTVRQIPAKEEASVQYEPYEPTYFRSESKEADSKVAPLKDYMMSEKVSQARQQQARELSVIIENSTLALEEMTAKARQIIELESGNILLEKLSDDRLSRTIIFDIPAKNYSLFLDKARPLGRIKAPPLEVSFIGVEGAKLRIRLFISVA